MSTKEDPVISVLLSSLYLGVLSLLAGFFADRLVKLLDKAGGRRVPLGIVAGFVGGIIFAAVQARFGQRIEIGAFNVPTMTTMMISFMMGRVVFKMFRHSHR